MDTLSKRELEDLTENPGGPCVSIFLPTHRAGVEIRQDPIRLKNLLGEARERLIETKGLRTTEADEILEPARELLSDVVFWRRGSDGLALFLSRDAFRFYRLPLSFEELAVLADRYHLKPLLPLLAGDGLFHVLALSQNVVRLLSASRLSVDEVELGEDVPESLAEALRFDDPEKQLQFHTGTGSRGGGRAAVFHGHGANDDSKDEILRYFRQIDRGLRDVLEEREAPLVLAGVDYLLPIYREASAYPALLDDGVTGNPEELSAEELHARAWKVVEPRFLQARREALELYAELAGTGRTSTDPRDAVPAAYYGRAETLFAASGARRWGTFDPGTGGVDMHDEPQAGDGDLLDFAAIQTILNGGDVYVTDPEEMPEGAEVACLFRY